MIFQVQRKMLFFAVIELLATVLQLQTFSICHDSTVVQNFAAITWSEFGWDKFTAEFQLQQKIQYGNGPLFLISLLGDIDRLMEERRNSIANALELRLSCIKPLIWW